MALTVKTVLGTQATLLSTELNALADNALVISSVIASSGVYNNTAGSGVSSTTGDGYKRGLLCLSNASLAGVPTAGGTYDVWFLKSIDAGSSNFEDGSASITPKRAPDASFAVDTSRSTAVVQEIEVPVPATYFKILFRNNATGRALNATTNTVKLIPLTDQGV